MSGFGLLVKLPRLFGFRVSGKVTYLRVSGFGFRVSGFGFWVSGFGFRVSGKVAKGVVWVQGYLGMFLRGRSADRAHRPREMLFGGLGFTGIQGYLAHKKTPTPLGPPQDPRHRPTVGS